MVYPEVWEQETKGGKKETVFCCMCVCVELKGGRESHCCMIRCSHLRTVNGLMADSFGWSCFKRGGSGGNKEGEFAQTFEGNSWMQYEPPLTV